ncbi:ATP-binding cassette domain-containing protein [Amylibacter sp.]|nr:ATP-binding cassette domain-containing protein [Amylibacter sp.]
MGARRSEIVRSIIGLTQAATGSIELNGNLVKFKSLRHAMRHGIGFVPEERKTEGLFLEQSLSNNLISASLQEHATLGMIHQASIKDASKAAIKAFSVKSNGIEENVGALSGGNQQKIMLAKWLKRVPDLLIIEEPTKGVDVGAKFQIHTELLRRAAKGMAILIVSSDIPELVSLCTRILVIHEGSMMGNIAAADASENLLLQMATGYGDIAVSNSQQTSGAAK